MICSFFNMSLSLLILDWVATTSSLDLVFTNEPDMVQDISYFWVRGTVIMFVSVSPLLCYTHLKDTMILRYNT